MFFLYCWVVHILHGTLVSSRRLRWVRPETQLNLQDWSVWERLLREALTEQHRKFQVLPEWRVLLSCRPFAETDWLLCFSRCSDWLTVLQFWWFRREFVFHWRIGMRVIWLQEWGIVWYFWVSFSRSSIMIIIVIRLKSIISNANWSFLENKIVKSL